VSIFRTQIAPNERIQIKVSELFKDTKNCHSFLGCVKFLGQTFRIASLSVPISVDHSGPIFRTQIEPNERIQIKVSGLFKHTKNCHSFLGCVKFLGQTFRIASLSVPISVDHSGPATQNVRFYLILKHEGRAKSGQKMIPFKENLSSERSFTQN
jgi:3-hydroxymyristoyl/3-hydroxydecanoyl-(acyl carrier protein) dehydratase